VDPTPEQWRELSALYKKKGHALFFDAAYLGFASGDAEKDAFALRQVLGETWAEWDTNHSEPGGQRS
jgi:aspartate aminotransferase